MGGRLPERLVQGREAGDHAVHADEGEHAEDRGGGDDQEYPAPLGQGLLVHADQDVDAGGVAKLRLGHIDGQRPIPVP